MENKDVIIIGGGPAGLAAAIYTGRADLTTHVFAGVFPSQIEYAIKLTNYPGFEGSGTELIQKMKRQAMAFKVTIEQTEATDIDIVNRVVNNIQGRTIIIATGLRPRLLGLPNEDRLLGHGISTCAVCDGEFNRGKDVIVVGGGDKAVEDANYLSSLAKTVTILVRGDRLRAMTYPKGANITVLYNVEIEEYKTDGQVLTGIILRENKGELPCSAVFIAIGGDPNSELFEGKPVVSIDKRGHLGEVPGTGIFIAGDVNQLGFKQAIIAAGQGAAAAIKAINYIRNQNV